MKTDEGHSGLVPRRDASNPTDQLGTGGPGLIIDPTGFEQVPVGFAGPYRTDLFDFDKPETSELKQGSFDPTWANSTVPDSGDGNNDALTVITTSAAPASSRECSCITCIDLGSERNWLWASQLFDYPCRLSDCDFSAPQAGQSPDAYDDQRAARNHEKNHFRHERQFRCMEDRCVYSTKRWSDLTRHYTSKHCLNPKTKFPCPEIGCKYGGNNGFTRKDKLKSHREKVHEKVAKPEKRFRVNKPNAQGAA